MKTARSSMLVAQRAIMIMRGIARLICRMLVPGVFGAVLRHLRLAGILGEPAPGQPRENAEND